MNSPQAVQQGGVTQPCVACKIRKKQNRYLKEQLTELEKEYHLLYNAKIKLETQLETLQDMLHREEKERQNLTSMTVVPKLKEVITLIESNNKADEYSGAQQMLKKMNDLLHEQPRYDVPRRKFHNSFGYSMLSLFSDTSSVVDIAAEEETARHNGTANDSSTISATQNGENSNNSAPVVSNTKMDKPMPPTKATIRSKTHAASHTAAGKEHVKITAFQSQVLEDITAREPLKELLPRTFRSDSTPASDWNKTRSAPLRKPRHNSASGATESSTKQEDLSQRRRKLTCPPSQTYFQQSTELQSRLEQQRKKIESSCEIAENH